MTRGEDLVLKIKQTCYQCDSDKMFSRMLLKLRISFCLQVWEAHFPPFKFLCRHSARNSCVAAATPLPLSLLKSFVNPVKDGELGLCCSLMQKQCWYLVIVRKKIICETFSRFCRCTCTKPENVFAVVNSEVYLDIICCLSN